MPSPIAHSVVGYALSRLPAAKKSLPGQVLSLTPLATVYGIVISGLPDLDFLPQIVTGLRFHRGPSHSLLAGILVSTLLAIVISQVRRRTHFSGLFKFTFGLYSLHLFMDLFTLGGNGLPLLWPLSDRTFRAPFVLFPAVHHSRGLLDPSHITFISVELLYAVLLFVAIKLINNRWQRNPHH